MTDNQQRADELAQRIGVYDTDAIRQELDEAEARGRQSVGLGDFMVSHCDEEIRSPYVLDAYGPWLPCTRREGHDGEHEHSDSGYTWTDR